MPLCDYQQLINDALKGNRDAIGQLLDNNKSPMRRTGELDNRGSHFYLALYCAQALAEQSEDKELKARFAPLAKLLTEQEQKIIEEMTAIQGHEVDIGGYYFPDKLKLASVMQPSITFNAALNTLSN